MTLPVAEEQSSLWRYLVLEVFFRFLVEDCGSVSLSCDESSAESALRLHRRGDLVPALHHGVKQRERRLRLCSAILVSSNKSLHVDRLRY